MKTYALFSFSSSHHAIAAEAVAADAATASAQVSNAPALETSGGGASLTLKTSGERDNPASENSGGRASEGEGLTEARLIPLPPEISAGCGLVLRVNEGGIKEAARLLAEAEIPYTGTYLLKTEKSERIVEKYDLS